MRDKRWQCLTYEPENLHKVREVVNGIIEKRIYNNECIILLSQHTGRYLLPFEIIGHPPKMLPSNEQFAHHAGVGSEFENSLHTFLCTAGADWRVHLIVDMQQVVYRTVPEGDNEPWLYANHILPFRSKSDTIRHAMMRADTVTVVLDTTKV